jgi:hypothetical protein
MTSNKSVLGTVSIDGREEGSLHVRDGGNRILLGKIVI